jgi:hypothetical protein
VHFAAEVANIAGVELPYKAGFFATPQNFADALEREDRK